ncbi:MAG: type II toxin-antitoxin system HicB family antitoxin [Candidatus Muiribacteriota bacterium]
MKNKDLDFYLNLPYTIELIPDDNIFFVKIKELEGCISQGDTIEEAYEMIKDAKRLWLQVALEEGTDIPFPESMKKNNFSGKILLRVSKSLHRELYFNSKKEGVSLNQYLNNLISSENSLINKKEKIIVFHNEDKKVIKIPSSSKINYNGFKLGENNG